MFLLRLRRNLAVLLMEQLHVHRRNRNVQPRFETEYRDPTPAMPEAVDFHARRAIEGRKLIHIDRDWKKELYVDRA